MFEYNIKYFVFKNKIYKLNSFNYLNQFKFSRKNSNKN